jgi:RHS repeat-associated protein
VKRADGTGLYYYRARYYHPQLQRFISEDPIGFAGGDANLHAYVGNDPVNATDPSGNINPIVAACGLGAAEAALGYVALNGRKSTLGEAAAAAGAGCVGGLVGLGIGRLASAALPRVMAATRRAPRACSVGQSFSGDTEVATEHGPRRIDRIRVGDRVLAYDEETGETSYQHVTATWAHKDPVIVAVTISGELVETTPEHPFSVVGRGWVKASDLRPGDRIHRAFGGTGPVTSVMVARQPQVMYNLTVDTAHTFFVGENQALVHNSSIGRQLSDAARRAHRRLPIHLRNSTIAIGIKNGRYLIAAFHPNPRLNAELLAWLDKHKRGSRSEVIGPPKELSDRYHAERQLEDAGVEGDIGISNGRGPCGKSCKPHFNQPNRPRITWPGC